MSTTVKMAKKQSHVTQRILDLTLEIIYLLTGEDYKFAKKTSNEEPPPNGHLHVPSSPDFMAAKRNKPKILAIINQISELLMGEYEEEMEMKVEVKEEEDEIGVMDCKLSPKKVDVMAAVIMEKPSVAISSDGSRMRNPPQRCPRHWDSSHLPIPRHDQPTEEIFMENRIKEEEEEVCVNDNQPMAEKNEMMTSVKEEKSFRHIRTNGSREGNPPERCPHPRDSPQEDLPTPHHDWNEEKMYIKVEIKEEEEEMCVSGDLQSTAGGGGVQMTSEGQKLFSCPEKVELFPAVDQRTNTNEPSLPSPEEGKNVTWKKIVHLRTHNDEALFTCSECRKCFIKKESLLIHQKNHTGERPFSCPECGKTFTRKQYLRRHQKTHKSERPFQCTECGKGFIEKGDLSKHQKIHTGEHPFSCEECGKSFIQKGDFNRHLRIHTGEHLFSCSECGKCFIELRLLLRHQIIHTGERPFSCAECGSSFNQKGSLLRHQRSHKGVRPFPCSECGKCFSQKSDLRKHQRIH